MSARAGKVGSVSFIDELRDDLLAADYTVDAVLARLGPAGQAGLDRNSTVPALRELGDARDALAILIRLFPLAQPVPLADVAAHLPLEALVAAGYLRVAGDEVCAKVDLRPYGFELPGGGQWDGWAVSDPTPGLDHDRRPTRPDYVLGVSPASTTLAQLTIPDQVGSALDLGTGCGVQSLHLSTHAATITATDVNPRVHDLAALTFALNGLDVDLRDGSLYEPVADRRFDLIVTNPPYVMSPPASGAERLVYREGGLRGDELVRTVVSGAADHLNPGGTAQVLANWAITDEPVADRLAGWAPPGADLWVIEREILDPYQYVEMWLTDAGLAGDPRWTQRYHDWLDYFAALGIRGVGMGWITVVNAGRDRPEIEYEQWQHEVAQPVGPALGRRTGSLDWAGRSDAELLAARWRIASDVAQETLGQPGAADPVFVVLRQTTGLRRARQVGTELGGVLGACDGELPLGVIIDAVASLLDRDAAALTQELLPHLRLAIVDGYLEPQRG